jgi:hypothetical protein
MVLNIFATLFVLGITFIHSIYGLFSGIINAFCAIVAMVVAFGYFQAVNDLLTGQFHLHPSYTEPLAFILLFVITLSALRFAADSFIRGNVSVPMWADWGGGAICGFVIAQICIGVLVLGVLMLPLGPTVMMFTRYERNVDNDRDPDTNRVEFEAHNLLLQSDRFTVGLFNLLSNGSLRTNTQFETVYPDFTDWVFYTANTVQEESLTAPLRTEERDGFTEGIRVDTWWIQDQPPAKNITVYRPELPTKENISTRRRNVVDMLPNFEYLGYQIDSGNALLGVRLVLRPASSDIADKKMAGNHRFRPTMIRIVGDVGTGDDAEPRQFVPQIIGGGDPVAVDNYRVVDYDANFSLPAGEDIRIDVLFEVPEDFTPRFIEYRRHARAPLTATDKSEQKPLDQLAAPYRDERGNYVRGRLGSFIDTIIRENSGPITALPITLNRNAGASATFTGDKLASIETGQVLAGYVDDLQGTGLSGAKDFEVPDDKRMLQFQAETRKLKSLLGQVFNFVGGRTNTYLAVDTSGRQYPLAGYYTLTNRNGRQYLTLFYTPDPAAVGYQGRLDKLESSTRRELENDENAVLGLIFVLPPGTCINAIRAGASNVDLQETFCVN